MHQLCGRVGLLILQIEVDDILRVFDANLLAENGQNNSLTRGKHAIQGPAWALKVRDFRVNFAVNLPTFDDLAKRSAPGE